MKSVFEDAHVGITKRYTLDDDTEVITVNIWGDKKQWAEWFTSRGMTVEDELREGIEFYLNHLGREDLHP